MGLADFATVKTKDHASFPGPGQYTQPSDFDPKSPRGRAATLRGRVETRQGLLTGTTEKIGPGKYEVPSTVGTAPGGKWVSTCRKTTTSTETPLGPKYEVQNYSMAANPATPRYSFGIKTTPRTRADDGGEGGGHVPAPPPRGESPTTDNTPRHKRKGPSFGIRPAYNGPTDVRSVGPGPGGYDVRRFGDVSTLPKAKAALHPHVEHDDGPKSDLPGPGAYDYAQGSIADVVRPKHQGHVLHGTMGGRNFPPDPKVNSVGPGQYENPNAIGSRLSSTSKKAGVSILGRFTEYTDMDDIYPRPAPGDYTIPSSFGGKGGKGFSFGSRHAELKPTTEVPGPGYVMPPQYSMGETTARSAKGVYFHAESHGDTAGGSTKGASATDKDTAARKDSTASPAKEPLPALPRLQLTQRTAPAFSLGGRHKPAESDNTGPGPGTYDMYKYDDKGRGPTFYRGPYSAR
jgi:hypothetical protein